MNLRAQAYGDSCLRFESGVSPFPRQPQTEQKLNCTAKRMLHSKTQAQRVDLRAAGSVWSACVFSAAFCGA